MNNTVPKSVVSIAPNSPTVRIDPFLRWAGSKRKVLPRLAKFWRPDYQRYVEPFVGCAALFFRLQPPAAVLGDINAELMHTYEIVRKNPDVLHATVTALPTGEAHYYRIRQQDPASLSALHRAARFVYLNRHCFNGIYRTNTRGQFNVPFGGHKPGVVPPVESFRKCAQLLARVKLRACDFGHVLRDTRKGDFVYLDPPYAVGSRRVFRQYSSREFTKVDLDRLAKHLCEMDRRGVHFVVSYAECREARRVFQRWFLGRIRVRRHVAGFVASRRDAYELVATNIDR